MKEGGAHAVKLEGGGAMVPQVAAHRRRRHPGDGAHRLHPAERARPRRLPGAGPRRRRPTTWSPTRSRCSEAGAFAVVLEMVPGEVAERVTAELAIPTIGIGAGVDCDGQVLVWQDMAGLRTGPMPRFVKQYADLRTHVVRGRRGVRRRRGRPGLPRRGAHLPLARRAAGATRCGQHGRMDSERARALRDLLGGSDWVQRTREFAVTLRRSTTPGGLLLVGTPDEEPWHLAAHLDDESRLRRPAGAVADLGALVSTAGGTAAFVRRRWRGSRPPARTRRSSSSHPTPHRSNCSNVSPMHDVSAQPSCRSTTVTTTSVRSCTTASWCRARAASSSLHGRCRRHSTSTRCSTW